MNIIHDSGYLGGWEKGLWLWWCSSSGWWVCVLYSTCYICIILHLPNWKNVSKYLLRAQITSITYSHFSFKTFLWRKNTFQFCPLLLILPYCTSDTTHVSSPHIKQFFGTTWVSYNLTQFWHYLHGERIRFYRLRLHKTVSLLPLQMPIPSPGCYLWFCGLAIHWEFPQLLPWFWLIC